MDQKKYWVYIGIAIIIFFLTIICFLIYSWINIQEKQFLISEETKCRDEAQKYYNEVINCVPIDVLCMYSKSDDLTYTSHYNTKMNKCLVELLNNTPDSVPSFTWEIDDPYSDTVYALGTDKDYNKANPYMEN